MWALVVGVVGVLTVAIAGTIALRRSKTPAERRIHTLHTFCFCLFFLGFFVLPGILAVLDVLLDPLFGPGQDPPLATAMVGVAAALAVAIAGAVAVRRRKTPAKRIFSIRFYFYVCLTFLVFFTLPGILAHLHVIPDPMTGLGLAAAVLVFFFLFRWAEEANVASP